jgi:hypothetical protein
MVVVREGWGCPLRVICPRPHPAPMPYGFRRNLFKADFDTHLTLIFGVPLKFDPTSMYSHKSSLKQDTEEARALISGILNIGLYLQEVH